MATSWVRSGEQIKKIEDTLARPAFLDGRTLTVTYLTRPEIIRTVLPPPLEPVGEPLVSVGVGTFGRSNCVGPFAGGWVDVRARYKGIEASYCLAMPMSTDVAIIFGRELFGEPKKQGRVRLESDGDVMRGTIERLGIPYLAVEARLTEDVPFTGPAESGRFHFKFMHSADGRGLEFDPIIVHAHFETRLRVAKRGQGKVIFKPSHHDPLTELEILEFRGAMYSEGDVYARAKRIGTVDAKTFLPYAFQNIDDYSAEF
jgi:Acetoacetate decarboxylase (ADC)